MQYTLEWVRDQVAGLKAEGKGNIRVHPNGFIQLDLAPTEVGWHESHKQGHSGALLRLHIWNPPKHKLPHQQTVNEIHDHVFDMRSTVVKGTLQQWLYHFVVGSAFKPSHELYRAVYSKKADSRLEATGVRGILSMQGGDRVSAGQSYTQPAFTLHDSDAHGCIITVMEKTEIHEGNPVVICPIETPPDNSYDRAAAAPVDFLWSAVEASIV